MDLSFFAKYYSNVIAFSPLNFQKNRIVSTVHLKLLYVTMLQSLYCMQLNLWEWKYFNHFLIHILSFGTGINSNNNTGYPISAVNPRIIGQHILTLQGEAKVGAILDLSKIWVHQIDYDTFLWSKIATWLIFIWTKPSVSLYMAWFNSYSILSVEHSKIKRNQPTYQWKNKVAVTDKSCNLGRWVETLSSENKLSLLSI